MAVADPVSGLDGRPVAACLDLGLAGWRIRLAAPLAAGTAVHVRYTVAHAVDEASDTVPPGDREAVAAWAAALLLEQRASHHAGDREPGLTVGDHVDFQGQAGRLGCRAKRLRQVYYDHLGVAPRRAVPASATVDFDRGSGLGGDRLLHRQGRR